jgi:radical SAM superfamily enzyme YgiQ (UPF0313 family)
MARVALIKPFTGLFLAVSLLAGELRRAGHDSRLIFFKDYRVRRSSETEGLVLAEYPAYVAMPRGETWTYSLYSSPTEREWDLLFEALEKFEPDLIGLSVVTSAIPIANEIAGRIKARMNKPIIFGGPGPIVQPERCLGVADAICANEGEGLIVELADRVERREDFRDLPGLVLLSEGKIVKTEKRPLVNLDEITVPDFDPEIAIRIEDDLVERLVAATAPWGNYTIMTTRGCPFSCSFCVESIYQEMFGKAGHLRRRSVDLVIAELVAAKERFDIRSVEFYDDVFTTHRSWLREFAAKYSRDVGLPFWCYTYPTTTRAEDLAILVDAGCVAMTMGIQSGSKTIRKDRFNRPTGVDSVVAAAELIRSFGIRLSVDLFTKVDFETEEDLTANLDIMMDLPEGVRANGFSWMVRLPNYEYTRMVERERPTPTLTDADYNYYHRLYYMALSDLPVAQKRALIADPLVRKFPTLLDPFQQRTTWEPLVSRNDTVLTGGRELLNTTLGQAIMDFPDPAESVGEAHRRLPLM